MSHDNTRENSYDQAKREAADQGGTKRLRNVSGFVLFVSGTILFAVFLVAASIYHANSNYPVARNWGMAALVAASIAIVAAYQYYVVAPARSVQKSVEVPADRPWLDVEVIPSGPITYLRQGDHISAFIPIIYRVTNRGGSPTSGIQLRADVFLARFRENPRERQRKIANWEGNPFHPGVVFPNTPVEHKITRVIPINEMKEAGINPGAPTSEQVKHFTAYVGGCISYTFGSNPVFHGETGFLYELNVHPVDSPENTFIVPEIGKEIPLAQLTTRRYFPVAANGQSSKTTAPK